MDDIEGVDDRLRQLVGQDIEDFQPNVAGQAFFGRELCRRDVIAGDFGRWREMLGEFQRPKPCGATSALEFSLTLPQRET